MKLTLVRRDRPYLVPRSALASLALLLLLGVAVATLPLDIESPVTCPFRAMTGLPCATCGTVRAAHFIMMGEFSSALSLNPLSVVLLLVAIPAALVLLFVNRVWGFAVDVAASSAERRAAWVVLAAVVLADWAYVLSAR